MATQVIDTFITWLKFDADTSGVVKSEKEMKHLEERTKKVNEVMETFRRTLEYVGAAFAIDKIIELNNEYDITQNKLKSVGLAGKELSTITQQILDISNATGTSLEANAELYQQLSVSLGEAANNAEKLKVMDTLTKIFAINGTAVAQSQMAIQDMSKALEGPTVRYQEIKRALNDIPALQAVISKHFKELGTSWQQAIQGDKFATKDFIKILTEANSSVTQQFKLMGRTIPQAFASLTNSMASFFGSVGQSSGIVEYFTGLIDSLSNSLGDMTTYIKSHIGEIKALASTVSIFLTMVAARLAIMGAMAAAPFLPMITALTVITLAIQDLYTFLGNGDSVFASFLSWLGLNKKQIDKVRDSINYFIQDLKDSIKYILSSKTTIISLTAVLGLLAIAWAVGKVISFSTAIIGAIRSVVELTKVTELLRLAVSALDIVIGIAEASLLPFEAIVFAIAAIITGLTFIFYEWGGAITKVIEDYLISGFKKGRAYLETFINFIKYAFKGLLSDIEYPFKKMNEYWGKLENKISGFGSKVKGMLGFGDSKISNTSTHKTILPKLQNNIAAFSSPFLTNPNINYATNAQTHNNTFNVTVNAQTNANANDIANETARQTSSMVGKHYRNAALNHDSKIKR